MKAAKTGLSSALDRPDPQIRFYLFHGPDEAGSRALAERLLKGLGAEKSAMLGQVVKADPAALADEAGAISLFGGRRAIWIEPAGDEIAKASRRCRCVGMREPGHRRCGEPPRKTSALLKLAEADPMALSHISYVPEGRDMERLIVDLPGPRPWSRPTLRNASPPRQRAVRRSPPRRRNSPSILILDPACPRDLIRNGRPS
jgi:DNA polymerase-3 subunit delta